MIRAPGYGQDCHVDGPAEREDMNVEIKDGNTKSSAVPADDSGTRQMLGNLMAC